MTPLKSSFIVVAIGVVGLFILSFGIVYLSRGSSVGINPAASGAVTPPANITVTVTEREGDEAHKALAIKLAAATAKLRDTEAKLAAMVLRVEMVQVERNQLLAKVGESTSAVNEYLTIKVKYTTLLNKYDLQYLELTKMNELREKYDALQIEHGELERVHEECGD